MRKKCKWYYVCPIRRFETQGKLDGSWAGNYCMGDFKKCVRYHMEERGEWHPDNMLPDGTIDKRL